VETSAVFCKRIAEHPLDKGWVREVVGFTHYARKFTYFFNSGNGRSEDELLQPEWFTPPEKVREERREWGIQLPTG
jgi:hypothetical protein